MIFRTSPSISSGRRVGDGAEEERLRRLRTLFILNGYLIEKIDFRAFGATPWASGPDSQRRESVSEFTKHEI